MRGVEIGFGVWGLEGGVSHRAPPVDLHHDVRLQAPLSSLLGLGFGAQRIEHKAQGEGLQPLVQGLVTWCLSEASAFGVSCPGFRVQCSGFVGSSAGRRV